MGYRLQRQFSQVILLNLIPIEQNSPLQLQRLAAQAGLYSRAKRIEGVQFLIAVVGGVIASTIALTHSPLSGFCAAFGILVASVDVAWLDPSITRLRSSAGRIRDAFDEDLFHIRKRRGISAYGITMEDVVDAAQKQSRSHERHRDWYPPQFGELPALVGVLLCQRTNAIWDAGLRHVYAIILACGFLLILLGTIIIALLYGLTLNQALLALYAPVFPALMWFLRGHVRHRGAEDSAQRMVQKVENTSELVHGGQLTDDVLHDEIVAIQDSMSFHRQSAPLVPDWLYGLLQTRLERNSLAVADRLVTAWHERKQRL